jgi:hypothetical protein
MGLRPVRQGVCGLSWSETERLRKGLAGRQGLEPRYADPESAVLPLDDLPRAQLRPLYAGCFIGCAHGPCRGAHSLRKPRLKCTKRARLAGLCGYGVLSVSEP